MGLQKVWEWAANDYKRSGVGKLVGLFTGLIRPNTSSSKQNTEELTPEEQGAQWALEDKATNDSFEISRIFALKSSSLSFVKPCMAARQANSDYESQYDKNVGEIITLIDNAIDKYGYTGTAEQQIFRNWIYFYLTSGDAQEINDTPELFTHPKKYKKQPFISSEAVKRALHTWDNYSKDHRFTYAQMYVPKKYFEVIERQRAQTAGNDAADAPSADPNS